MYSILCTAFINTKQPMQPGAQGGTASAVAVLLQADCAASILGCHAAPLTPSRLHDTAALNAAQRKNTLLALERHSLCMQLLQLLRCCNHTVSGMQRHWLPQLCMIQQILTLRTNRLLALLFQSDTACACSCCCCCAAEGFHSCAAPEHSSSAHHGICKLMLISYCH